VRGEVVVAQLITLVRVIPVLEVKSLSDGECQRYLATVLAHGATQGADWVIGLAERHVIPARDGVGRNVEITPGHVMRPGLLGKRVNCALERPMRVGRAQE
jgi:hypothetical protein